MRLWCCGCQKEVEPRLVTGFDVYKTRLDLYSLPFWKCDACGNFVGCHHKTKDRTKPLGCIPTPAIKAARTHIHDILDPIWKERKMSRKALYAELTACLGREYHTAELRSVEEARMIYRKIKSLAAGLDTQ